MENTLKASYISEITAAIEAESGLTIGTPNHISGLSAGLANAIIPFLVSNAQVNTVDTGTATVTSAPGTAPVTGTGMGTIS
jgi:hypothetical protein